MKMNIKKKNQMHLIITVIFLSPPRSVIFNFPSILAPNELSSLQILKSGDGFPLTNF